MITLDFSSNQIAIAASICLPLIATITHTNTVTAPSVIPSFSPATSSGSSNKHFIIKKPIVVKPNTNQIKVCHSCRQNYDGSNDTMGLVVVDADRHLVFNLSTGTQFLGRVCNSHYHLYLLSLKKVDPSFIEKSWWFLRSLNHC